MRAAQVTTLDGPDAVRLAEVDPPEPSDDKVLIEVHSAGVTFPDVLLTRGDYQIKPRLPFIPGCEVGGTVRHAGPGAGVTAGDRVAAFPAFGGFAELVSADPAAVFPVPDRLSFGEAAGLPMNYLTVHFALTRRGGLRSGESVLVHGAAGGIGTAAVQLAHVLGARVVAVVSSPEKVDTAKAAGADDVILAEGFRDAVKDLTAGRGVDMVVDPVGGDRFTDSLRSLAVEGRLLVIGFTGGEIPTVKVNRLLLNNISVVGVGWGAFWVPRPQYLQEQWADLAPHVASGDLVPPLGASFPLDQTAAAIEELDERRATGKVTVTVR